MLAEALTEFAIAEDENSPGPLYNYGDLTSWGLIILYGYPEPYPYSNMTPALCRCWWE